MSRRSDRLQEAEGILNLIAELSASCSVLAPELQESSSASGSGDDRQSQEDCRAAAESSDSSDDARDEGAAALPATSRHQPEPSTETRAPHRYQIPTFNTAGLQTFVNTLRSAQLEESRNPTNTLEADKKLGAMDDEEEFINSLQQRLKLMEPFSDQQNEELRPMYLFMPPPVMENSWEMLEAGQTGLVEDWSLQQAARALVMSELLSREPSPPLSDEAKNILRTCTKRLQSDQDDLEDTGYIFSTELNPVAYRLNLLDFGPCVDSVLYADRPLIRDVYSQKENVKPGYFPCWMKDVDPITVFRQLFLDRELLAVLTGESNDALARMNRDEHPAMKNCKQISTTEMETFILVSCLSANGFSGGNEPENPQEDFYFRFMMSEERMAQISHLFRLKGFGETSDDYLVRLNVAINVRLKYLHRRLPKVLTVHTYNIGLSRQEQSVEVRPTRSLHVTVVRAGYVLYRMQIHHRPEDTQRSGLHATAGFALLDRLFHGIDINRRYIVMAGEANLNAAEYFMERGARFIGSTGPHPAVLEERAAHKQGGFTLPVPPRCTLYFEPVAGMREFVVVKRVCLYERKKNVYFKIPRSIITESHIMCTIGASSFVPLSTTDGSRSWLNHLLPLNSLLMMRMKKVNEFYEENYRSRTRFSNCCLNWHQNALFHALFSGFISCWMSHAAARNRPISAHHATKDLLERLLKHIALSQEEYRRYTLYQKLVHEIYVMKQTLQSLTDTSQLPGPSEPQQDSDNQNKQKRNEQGMSKEATSEDDKELQMRKVIEERFLVKVTDGKIEAVDVLLGENLLQIDSQELVDIVTHEQFTETAFLNIHDIEEHVRSVGRGSEGEWLRSGVPLPDSAFSDLGETDSDSSDHDSDAPIDHNLLCQPFL